MSEQVTLTREQIKEEIEKEIQQMIASGLDGIQLRERITDKMRQRNPSYSAMESLMRTAAWAEARSRLEDNARGETALISAVSRGENIKKVRQLLGAGANVNATDNDGLTALMQVHDAETAKLLIEAGAGINAADKAGRTALMHVVASFGTVEKITELVKALIDAGADVNAADDDGKTALHYSVGYLLGRMDPLIAALPLLIEAGANVNAADDNGETALMHLIEQDFSYLRGNNEEIRDFGQHWSLGIRDFQKNDEDWNDSESDDDYGVSDAMICTIKCKAIEMLIDAGTDVNAVDNNGKTALSMTYDENIEQLLLNAGAKETD